MLKKSATMLLVCAIMGTTPVLSAAGVTASAASMPATPADKTILANTPEATINALDAALIKSMQGGSRLGYRGRYRIVAPVVQAAFDYPRIASLTLGAYWNKLSPEQQKEFVGVLADYTAATYAARFNSFNGEHFAIVSSETLQSGTEGIFSTFTQRNGKAHRFDYILQKQGGQWRIVNVFADGVSDLALKRAEYTETVQKKGFAALVAHLKAQIAGYAKGSQ
ncbi:HpnM family protein [Acidithiobacillus ferriphilus]|uniref:HpnM family protein n=1 Tax=Acidithiobacillus ferriphilus TaxID=1689834 RepID=UPI001C067E51|nr:HpnM family protein [Acidithiobacillus ferriphilus]MBU2828653.1 HpnM family protein [Acidithiobacillus ferriphilus]